MSKRILVFFSIFLIIISLWGIGQPSSSFEWLLSANNRLDQLRTVIASTVLMLTYIPLQPGLRRSMFAGIGSFMVALLAGMVFMPGTYSAHNIYLMPLDVVTLLEGSVIGLLAYMNTAPHEPLLVPSIIKPAKRQTTQTVRQA